MRAVVPRAQDAAWQSCTPTACTRTAYMGIRAVTAKLLPPTPNGDHVRAFRARRARAPPGAFGLDSLLYSKIGRSNPPQLALARAVQRRACGPRSGARPCRCARQPRFAPTRDLCSPERCLAERPRGTSLVLVATRGISNLSSKRSPICRPYKVNITDSRQNVDSFSTPTTRLT